MPSAHAPHRDAVSQADTDRIVGGSRLLGELRDQLIVRSGKGAKDRVTLLPPELIEPIRAQMAKASELHRKDLADGLGEVYLPYALERKYPNASRQWGWQYLFPAGSTATDPRSGKTRRHHIGESSIQKAVKGAIVRAGIHQHGSCHTLRHSFATHLLEDGYDSRTVQELLATATCARP